jgi:tetratricopeptide (TPR) repeat protein
LGAHAQAPASSAAAPVEYRDLIDTALGEYQAGNFAEARALFLRAHAQFPNARSLRGLGMVEFELKNYADCVRWLELALAETERQLEGDMRNRTAELLTRARTFVDEVRVQVLPEDVAGAFLTIDGVAHAPSPGPVLLAVGEHELLLRAPGYGEVRQRVNVRGGGVQSVSLRLMQSIERSAARAEATPAEAKSPAAESAHHSTRRSRWVWAGVALGIVAAATMTGVLVAKRPDDAGAYEKGDIDGPVFTRVVLP